MARPNTARVLPAVPDPARAPAAAQTPAAPATDAPGPGAAALADAIPTTGGRGAQIAALAKAELDRGVAEQPPGSNDGPRIAEYRTATKGSGVGPWCAYFTSWVAAKAGVPVGPDGTGIGYVPTLKNWAEQTDRYIPSGSGPPQVGDLVVFDHEGDGVLDHVGVVTGTTPDGGIQTVEGNSGDKVAAHSYGRDGYAGLVRLVKPGEQAAGVPAAPAVAPIAPGAMPAVPPPAPAVAPVSPDAAAPPLAAPPAVPSTPAPPPSEGRASAVFGAVGAPDPAAATPGAAPPADAPMARPNTARVLPAVPDPARAPAAAQTPAAPATDPPGPGAAALADAIPTTGGRGAQIAALAKAELDRGVAEQPPGSNDGPRIAEYRTATKGSGVGPWCAYFTSWVAAKAGVPVGPDGTGIGYVPTLKNWAEQTDRYIPSGSGPPQVGDLVVFDHEGDGVLDHVGVVTGTTPDGGIQTVEGNSGDKVAAHSYGRDGYAGLVRLVKPGEQAAGVPAAPAVAPIAPGAMPAVPPPAPAVAPVSPDAAAPPLAAPPAVPSTPAPPPSEGRASAVFGAVGAADPAAATPGAAPSADAPMARPNTARVLPAVPDPARAAPAPPASTPPPVIADPAPVPPAGVVATAFDAYPGDSATKEQVALWMARTAQAAGLPPELPVMAALVESGLSNLDHGDADSLGFFQMRGSVWNAGEYAGYPEKPELQMKWFVDQAVEIKRKRLEEGAGGLRQRSLVLRAVDRRRRAARRAVPRPLPAAPRRGARAHLRHPG